MSSPVLYAVRLYGPATYSTNIDPQTFSVALADTLSAPSDTEVAALTAPLADTLAAQEAGLTFDALAVLASSVTAADELASQSSFSLADLASPTDEYVPQNRVALTDLVVVKEFISIVVKRALAWTVPVAHLASFIRPAVASSVWKVGGTSRTVTPHMYGVSRYADNMYSTNIALLWTLGVQKLRSVFTNQDGNKNN